MLNKPSDAPVIDVDKIISDKILPEGTIKENSFIVLLEDINAEIFEGNVTWMKYLNLFREDTNTNFKKMDIKYDKISSGLFAVVERLEKRDEMFEIRIEKTEKNIEKILEFLQKKWHNCLIGHKYFYYLGKEF